jgi:hypothetical protein
VTERVGLEVDTLTIRIPMRLQRRGGRKLIMTPEGVAAPARKPSRDETLVKALVRAHRWRRRIESGQAKSITDLAEQEGVTDAYVCRLLTLTCLAPEIVEAILDGRQPKGLRLVEILGNGPVGWEEQRESVGSTAIIRWRASDSSCPRSRLTLHRMLSPAQNSRAVSAAERAHALVGDRVRQDQVAGDRSQDAGEAVLRTLG